MDFDNWRRVVISALEDVARIMLRLNLTDPLVQTIAGSVGGGFEGVGAATPRTFAGGGYTGNAPRSGGLDGQGGFMAMLHPRESVIDHTRGGGATANMLVRIEDHNNSDVTVERETDARGIEELVVKIAARNIRQGGDLGKAVNQVTGTTRRGAQR